MKKKHTDRRLPAEATDEYFPKAVNKKNNNITGTQNANEVLQFKSGQFLLFSFALSNLKFCTQNQHWADSDTSFA